MAVSTIKTTPVITQTISASDYISFNSAFSATNAYIAKYGRLMIARFVMTNENALNANSNNLVGTVKTGYRPTTITTAGGVGYYGLLDTNGNLYLRPRGNRTAGSSDNVIIPLYIFSP